MILKNSIVKLSLLLFISCGIDIKAGAPGASMNIDYSKRNDLFISEFTPSQRFIKLGNPNLNIKEAWVEKGWYIKDKDLNKGIYDSLYQFVITFEEENIDQLLFRCSRIEKQQNTDTLKYLGCGWINDIINVELKQNELTKDTINFCFFNQKDTVQVDFVKKQGNRKF
jgi:hypothetical protein